MLLVPLSAFAARHSAASPRRRLGGVRGELMAPNSLLFLRSAREESKVAQPVGARLRPGGARMIALADTKVVGGACIYMQLRRDAGSFQSEIHQHTILRRADDVVSTVRQEDRGCPARYAEARSELVLILRLEVTRIDRNGKVGPATDFIHVIDRFVAPFFEACRRCDCQMA